MRIVLATRSIQGDLDKGFMTVSASTQKLRNIAPAPFNRLTHPIANRPPESVQNIANAFPLCRGNSQQAARLTVRCQNTAVGINLK